MSKRERMKNPAKIAIGFPQQLVPRRQADPKRYFCAGK
jgi:hypothetical protein